MTAGFITLHDTGDHVSKRRHPEGKMIRVRGDSIDVIRPYADGRVRTVLAIHGVYYHVAETEDQILDLIRPGARWSPA